MAKKRRKTETRSLSKTENGFRERVRGKAQTKDKPRTFLGLHFGQKSEAYPKKVRGKKTKKKYEFFNIYNMLRSKVNRFLISSKSSSSTKKIKIAPLDSKKHLTPLDNRKFLTGQARKALLEEKPLTGRAGPTPLEVIKPLTGRTVQICDKISKGSIYLLVFLLPLFLLPWTANVLDFNKQALLLVLISVSLFAWMFKVLVSGKFSFNLTKFHIPVVVLFLVYLASTVFSLWRYGSFWGWPLTTSESLLTVICLFLLYFLVSNIFRRKEVFHLITLLILSGFLAMLYGVFQLFGKFILPLDFTKTTSFNTIGTVNILGLFAAVLLPLTIVLIIKTKNLLRWVFIAALVLDVVLLLLINFSAVWWVVIVGASLVILLGFQKTDFFDNRWLVLPMFFLAIALFFSFFKFQIPAPLSGASRPIEVFLTQRAGFDIAWKTLKENPILGSGPGTFVYDFSKYKDISFNQNRFWNVRFEGAGSKIFTTLATTGILGILSLLTVMAFFVFYGIKFLFGKKHSLRQLAERGSRDELFKEETNEGFYWMLGAGIFISFAALSVGFFLYHSNLTLNFLFFLLLGSFIALLFPVRKEIILKPSSLSMLGVTFAFTLIFIFGLGLFILEGQRYAAEVSYLEGTKARQQGRNDDAMNNLERAARINPGVDLYWRELSQIYLRGINIEAAKTDLSREEINRRIQFLINNAVNSAKVATDINPSNVANWSVRGFIYQNLTGVIPDVKSWAIQSYDKALSLEPTNPYYFNQEGIVFLQEAFSVEEKEQKQELLTQAKTKFNKSIELKPDYAPARFQLASVYQLQGKTEEAIQELETAKTLAPFNVGLAFQLGLIYYQNEDYSKAQAEFERTIGISPNYSNALYFLGMIYNKRGEKAKAIEKFEKVSELNPDNGGIRKILDNLKADRPVLEEIAEEMPPVVPIEENLPPERGEEEEGE